MYLYSYCIPTYISFLPIDTQLIIIIPNNRYFSNISLVVPFIPTMKIMDTKVALLLLNIHTCNLKYSFIIL